MGWQHSWQHLLSSVAVVTADLSRATGLRSATAGDCASPRRWRGRLRPCRGSSASGSRASGGVAEPRDGPDAVRVLVFCPCRADQDGQPARVQGEGADEVGLLPGQPVDAHGVLDKQRVHRRGR